MSWIQPLVDIVRDYGIKACEAKAQRIAAGLVAERKRVANVGGGASVRWPFAVVADAMRDPEMDFNTRRLYYDDGVFDVVVCEQVIEHLHNTTFFLSELRRILRPGGHLLLSTENLASWPNVFALLLQRAPFSTQAVCGRFVGGWKDGEACYGFDLAASHPTFSGVKGHVRVMTTGQLRELLERAGFVVWSKHGYGGNHYVLFHACKPSG